MNNGKKRLVFFTGALVEGGAERVISIITKALAEANNYDITILLYYDKPIFYDLNENVKVVCVKRETGSDFIVKNMLYIRRFFRNHADIVISFLAPFNIVALISSFALTQKIIVADRNDPRHIPSNWFVRKLRDVSYIFASGIVVQNERNKAYFSDRLKKKSTIIYNPVNSSNYACKALLGEKRTEIVSVGRLVPQKNHKLLIEAFSIIHKKYPEYKLLIYGEGVLRDELEKMIKDLGLENKVFLMGNVKNLHEEMANSQIFVLPSLFEGMPNALIEAMCLGLACISTKVSGATDLIRNRYNGILIDANSMGQLISSLELVISDHSLRKTIARNAVSLNEQLSVEKIVCEWEKYIKMVDEK